MTTRLPAPGLPRSTKAGSTPAHVTKQQLGLGPAQKHAFGARHAMRSLLRQPLRREKLDRIAAGSAAPPPPPVEMAQPANAANQHDRPAPEQRQAVVVGAGPAGIVMAMYLSRQGFRVTVLERRPDPTTRPPDPTFVMGLTPRGVGPLMELGVTLPTDGWLNNMTLSKGSVMHMGGDNVTVREHPSVNILAERSAVAIHLLKEARRLHPHIQFRFDADIQAIDLQSKTVSAAIQEPSSSGSQQLKYDLLIGADGINSQVRTAIVEQEPNFSASTKGSNTEYTVLRDLPQPADLAEPELAPEEPKGRHLHMFVAASLDDMRQPIRGCGAYAQQDGRYSSAVQFKRGYTPPSSAAEAEEVLRAGVPGWPQEWYAPAAQQLAGAKLRSWGSTVTASHLAVPWAGVALVGDAGHGVTPNFGQGCNSALETCAFLDKVLAANSKDLVHALSEYDQARKPDMAALRHLDSISDRFFGAGDMKGFGINWVLLGTLANIWVSGLLHKLVPSVFRRPAMLSWSSSTAPYRSIVWERHRDLALLAAAFVALIVGVAEIGAWLMT